MGKTRFAKKQKVIRSTEGWWSGRKFDDDLSSIAKVLLTAQKLSRSEIREKSGLDDVNGYTRTPEVAGRTIRFLAPGSSVWQRFIEATMTENTDSNTTIKSFLPSILSLQRCNAKPFNYQYDTRY